MESLFLLVPVALIFVVLAIKVFFWAVNSGQYDDLDTEAHRILFDDEPEYTDASSSSESESSDAKESAAEQTQAEKPTQMDSTTDKPAGRKNAE